MHFNVVVNHKVIENLKIGKKEKELPKKNIARLVEHLSVFSYDLKFKPGKGMLASDALSWLQIEEKYNTRDVILLNFLQHEAVNDFLQERYFQMASANSAVRNVRLKTTQKQQHLQ